MQMSQILQKLKENITVHASQIPTMPPKALKWIFQNMLDNIYFFLV